MLLFPNRIVILMCSIQTIPLFDSHRLMTVELLSLYGAYLICIEIAHGSALLPPTGLQYAGSARENYWAFVFAAI